MLDILAVIEGKMSRIHIMLNMDNNTNRISTTSTNDFYGIIQKREQGGLTSHREKESVLLDHQNAHHPEKHWQRFSIDVACSINLSTCASILSTVSGLKSRPVSLCCTRLYTNNARSLRTSCCSVWEVKVVSKETKTEMIENDL
jgi:hypothetical protein